MCTNVYNRSNGRFINFNDENLEDLILDDFNLSSNPCTLSDKGLNAHCLHNDDAELSEGYVVQLIIKILEALIYMHENLNIVHLDVKVSFIFIYKKFLHHNLICFY